MSWRITVDNLGPATAVDARVVDLLPSGLTGVSATASAGSCVVTASVTCSLGDLGNGAQATVDISATVDAAFRGQGRVGIIEVDELATVGEPARPNGDAGVGDVHAATIRGLDRVGARDAPHARP